MQRWHRTGPRPRIWAHRGDSAHQTENTLAAFAAARAAGADGVELDVRLDADGVPVVFHDDDLRRLAGRPEAVEALPSAARAAVELIGGHRIPTLVETLAACAGLDVNVELKVAGVRHARPLARAVAAVLATQASAERIIVSSFDPLVLGWLRGAAPTIARAYLFHAEQAAPARRGWPALALAVAAVHPEHVLVTPDRVAAWHHRGWAVTTWTVDDERRLRELTAAGVDGIVTNDPARALAALR